MAPPIHPQPPISNPEPIEEEPVDSFWELDDQAFNNLQWISSSSLRIPQGNPMPLYGSFSLKGPPLQRDDMWFVMENFCQPDIVSGQCLHFFAVFDDHGSSYVSSLCRDRMHLIIAEELLRIQVGFTVRGGRGLGSNASSSTSALGISQHGANEVFWNNHILVALKTSFMRMDQEALGLCSRVGASNIGTSQPAAINFTGSLANVAILCPRHIVVANCSDSRAVLCRAGEAILLARDHKSYIQDKLYKIHVAGGKFMQSCGLPVNWISDVTPLIDNLPFKRDITSEPEITITERHEADEFLILASNALWRHFSYASACNIARCCLKSGIPAAAVLEPRHIQGRSIYNEESELYPPKLAASTLCRLAFGRENQDSITVVVVDLKNFAEKK